MLQGNSTDMVLRAIALGVLIDFRQPTIDLFTRKSRLLWWGVALIQARFRQARISRTLKEVGDLRFELRTNRLRVYCSTVELVTHTKAYISKYLTDLLVQHLSCSQSLAGKKLKLKGELYYKGGLTCCTLYMNFAA
jgi:hypothetical protein